MTRDSRNVRRLAVECPVCNRNVDERLRVHLRDAHTKEELASELVAYVAAEEPEVYG